MKLPLRVQVIVRALYERHSDLAHGDDEARRILTRRIAEQTRFELGPSWGHKASSPTNPPSKDAIAWRSPNGGLLAWDLFDGTTREPFDNPDSIDITGQHFIEVPAVDHLGIGPEPPEPPEPPAPPSVGIGELVDVLMEIAANQASQGVRLEAIARQLAELKAEVTVQADRIRREGVPFRVRF